MVLRTVAYSQEETSFVKTAFWKAKCALDLNLGILILSATNHPALGLPSSGRMEMTKDELTLLMKTTCG